MYINTHETTIQKSSEVDNHSTLTMGLVSMPWMAPTIPSIQLATLASALKQEGIEVERHELFVDYAAHIGLKLYNILCNTIGFTAEWIFAQHYFGPETGNYLTDFRQYRPRLGLENADLEEQTMDILHVITEEFLDGTLDTIDWSKYTIIGFSLTISQLASSMAMAQRIKKKFPNSTIFFGGSGCAGEMGKAILHVCPYVDIVVHGEGEQILPELTRKVHQNKSLKDIYGISWRNSENEVLSTPSAPLYQALDKRPTLCFDPYFQRLKRLDLHNRLSVWIPFESSRGCWYGEKSQCSFCGLHEIMKYRKRNHIQVLEELEELNEKYGVNQFFAVDLILPREYFQGFIPELISRSHEWLLFYEVKANMKKQELEQLSKAGIRWIQPGIESLNTDILRLMRKGVSALQNIQLLKWCQEYDMRVTWNLIGGLPGEKEEYYREMASMMPLLHHLIPPSGIGRFQLHRFSPYFNNPQSHGIKYLGAHPLYRYIFPVSEQDLNNLVYLHDYELEDELCDMEYLSKIQSSIDQWQQSYQLGAKLVLHAVENGHGEIIDTRSEVDGERIYRLNPYELSLYLYLDSFKGEQGVERNFHSSHPAEAERLTEIGGINVILERWKKLGLVIAADGCILALAVTTNKASLEEPDLSKFTAPLSYLESMQSPA
jgi:ribosomal peptide maturation radical SAM protein 1